MKVTIRRGTKTEQCLTGKRVPRCGAVFSATMQSSTFASAQRPSFKSLTSLRFVAAMTVVLYHYFSLNSFSSTDAKPVAQVDPISRAVGTYLYALTNGYLAVGFFFMLSGFVLAYAHFTQLADGTFEYAHFL